jgi:CRP/FNR family transcriptional activator FtrB
LAGLIKDPNESPARIVLPFEKRRLAAKVGCSEENLSRAFSALRPFGVVTERSVVIACDVPALRAFASASGWRKTSKGLRRERRSLALSGQLESL